MKIFVGLLALIYFHRSWAKLNPATNLHDYIEDSGVGLDLHNRGYRRSQSSTQLKGKSVPLGEIITTQARYIDVQPKYAPAQETRTVIVTPRPKYTPSRLVPEPKYDANNKKVPVMEYTVDSSLSKMPEHINIKINPGSNPFADKTIEFRPHHSHQRSTRPRFPEGTFVDTIPALSVAIPSISPSKTHVLADYLTPPKFPSVYDAKPKFQPSIISDHLAPNKISATYPNKPSSTFDSKAKKQQLIELVRNPTKFKSKEKDESPKDAKKKKEHLKSQIPPSSLLPLTSEPVEQLPSNADSPKSFKAPKVKPPQRQKAAPSAPNPTVYRDYSKEMNEQITSETGFSGAHAHPHGGVGSSSGQRVEFQMHGQNGPDSYKFGYDTGKGTNRQFRYEEKDKEGNVKGHYGYYDKDGKLQVINYTADHNGYRAHPA